MAQGSVKSASRPAPTGKPKNSVRKTSKVTKPQKAKSTCAADKMQKKLTAGMAARTEKMLGQRVGHLELIGKGNRAQRNEEGKEKFKGGSRKFG
jgi:hypothetical protein